MSTHQSLRNSDLITTLESIYHTFHRPCYLSSDPLCTVYFFDDPGDREITALFAAGLAYGRVPSILRSIKDLLERMERAPMQFVEEATVPEVRRALHGFQHRWTTADEVVETVLGVRQLRSRYGSLEAAFLKGMGDADPTILPALSRWVRAIKQGKKNSLFADPVDGSACKRMCLFLRWMVRSDPIDPGCWSQVSPSKLIIPLDTHMHEVALRLGLTRRKQANLRTAEEITTGFRNICPADPTRYDFALTRPGILSSPTVIQQFSL